jgi:uncharacterized spore protein YtfJ
MSQTMVKDMTPLETVREIVEHAAANHVFGSPVVRDDVTVLPVARINGGGGGGSGSGPAANAAEATGTGTGGGVGVAARPLGVYAIKEGKVRWLPAVDVNRIILGGQIVVAVALLTLRALVKARSRKQTP